MYNQKEIVLVPFPYSDLSSSKQRPALIISNKMLNKAEDRICCLITSNISKEGIRIQESSFEEGNLPFESFVKPSRLFTIDKRIIRKKLCTVNNDFYDKIIEKINESIKRV